MAERTSNDNDERDPVVRFEPDPYGQAAMLLIESLIHRLIERSTITIEDAIEIVQVAGEVKDDIGEELGDSPATLARSLALLKKIEVSLSNDLITR